MRMYFLGCNAMRRSVKGLKMYRLGRANRWPYFLYQHALQVLQL